VWSLALEEYEFMSALIDAGAAVRSVNRLQLTPLLFAADLRDERGLRILLAKGADATEGLLFSVRSWDLELVDLFLEAGADLAELAKISDATVSLFRTHGNVLRHLVKAGAVLPTNIVDMLEKQVALGDAGKPSMPKRPAWRGR